MDVHEYLKAVSDQIITVSIRGPIRQELADHLEDQREAFLEEGMDEQEAEEAAVLEMGDPVEVGLTLNEIHKPKPTKWHVRCVMALSGLLFLSNVLYIYFGKESALDSKEGTLLALLVLMGVYFVVYFGVIAGSGYYSELVRNEPLPFGLPGIWACICLGMAIGGFLTNRGISVFGDLYFFSGGLLLVFELLHLLFYYRHSRHSWLINFLAPAAFGLCALFLNHDLTMTAEITSIYACIYTYAYRHNWFTVKRKFPVYVLWAMPLYCIGRKIYFILKLKYSLFLPKEITGNTWDYSLLPEIGGKTGDWAAYLVLFLGIAIEIYMIYQYRKSSNKWSKIYFLSASMILGVMVMNGALTLFGLMNSMFSFSPFLWKLIENHETNRIIDFTQTILIYLLAGYTTRFVSRDSVLGLEIEKKSYDKKGVV